MLNDFVKMQIEKTPFWERLDDYKKLFLVYQQILNPSLKLRFEGYFKILKNKPHD